MKFLLSPFLFLLSIPYRVGVTLDRVRRSRNQARLGRVVISVGNLTMGGTGKTPLVIRLANEFKSLQIRPAVLSRGYRGFMEKPSKDSMVTMRPENSTLEIINLDGSKADPSLLSDEVNLMAEKLPGVPIGTGANRIQTARFISDRSSPDVFILDDGFQHWPIRRDLDVVCIDATDPWGGGLLPLGRSREPVCQLKRAGAVVLTRTELAHNKDVAAIEKKIKAVAPQAEIFQSEMVLSLWSIGEEISSPPSELYGKPVLALSALGRPQGFESSLRRAGAYLTPLRFRDHHIYSEADIDRIEALLKKMEGWLVTTEKDWAKLKRTRWGQKMSRPPCLFLLKIEIKFLPGHEERWQALLKKEIHEIKTLA